MPFDILGDPEVTANLYCNFAYPYWEGCVICSILFAVTSGSPSSYSNKKGSQKEDDYSLFREHSSIQLAFHPKKYIS